jgi:EAL domain-containing protein (putative c-di-GMP-specific phosphodiesterase class I)
VRQQVSGLLHTARNSLGLSVAFLTRMDGVTQHVEVVDAAEPFLPEGASIPQASGFCQHILDGHLPAVMPDLTAYPLAMRLPPAATGVRSFVSVPVVLSDGRVYGTFCAAGLTTKPDLVPRDRALMEVLAQAASVVIEPGVREAERREEIENRMAPVLTAGGPTVVLQPIVDLVTGARIGAEALSRFPAEWGLPPDVCFAQAHSVGLGHRLEVVALTRAADHLDRVPGYIAMNISPKTLLTDECVAALRTMPAERVVLELSEHEQVEDYEALAAVLAPLRARGMRLAIDDVGAGFSSLRHIVVTAPDIIKLDRSLVAGISEDPVLTTLVRSLVRFGHGCGTRVVAEGVETAADAAALPTLGVDHGQGWHFGRPGPPEALPAAVTPAGSRRAAA